MVEFASASQSRPVAREHHCAWSAAGSWIRSRRIEAGEPVVTFVPRSLVIEPEAERERQPVSDFIRIIDIHRVVGIAPRCVSRNREIRRIYLAEQERCERIA